MSLPTREIACPACRTRQTVHVLEVQLALADCSSCRAVLPLSVLAPPPPPLEVIVLGEPEEFVIPWGSWKEAPPC